MTIFLRVGVLSMDAICPSNVHQEALLLNNITSSKVFTLLY